jgi:hypothetical protein
VLAADQQWTEALDELWKMQQLNPGNRCRHGA